MIYSTRKCYGRSAHNTSNHTDDKFVFENHKFAVCRRFGDRPRTTTTNGHLCKHLVNDCDFSHSYLNEPTMNRNGMPIAGCRRTKWRIYFYIMCNERIINLRFMYDKECSAFVTTGGAANYSQRRILFCLERRSGIAFSNRQAVNNIWWLIFSIIINK